MKAALRALTVSGFASLSIVSALSIASILTVASASFAAENVPPPPSGPFGPGYDPTRPPPTEPEQSGPGIVSASVTAAGAADVEELRDPGAATSPAYVAVALDVRIPAGSTTALLTTSSVVAKSEEGRPTPVFALCVPTAEPPLSVHQRPGATIRHWHISIQGRLFFCGGRNARMAVQPGEAGVRLSADSDWNGPMVLLFKAPAAPIRSVVVTGLEVELPRPKTDGDKTH